MALPHVLHDPISRLIELAAGTPSRVMIALAGYPGSGKSTAANTLYGPAVEQALGPGSIQILGMDGFHLSKAELAAMPDPEETRKRRGAPWTFNPRALISSLRKIKQAESAVGWPGFDHGHGDPVDEQITVKRDTRLILVEGIYLLHRQDDWAGLEGIFDESWFLDVDIETALARACQRHQDSWGISTEQAQARIDGNDRLNCAFINRDKADWLIPYEID